MEETKIIYHIDEEETPYLVKLPIPADKVTLGDFKNVLNRPSYKFFFKSMDDDFGVVKEEIVEDEMKLPCFNGRVVSWLVTADSSVASDSGSQCAESQEGSQFGERQGGNGDSRPPSFHPNAVAESDKLDDTTTETESVVSSRRDRRRRKDRQHSHSDSLHRMNGHSKHRSGHGYESSSVMTSDVDSTSFFETTDDDSRFSSCTESTRSSRKMHKQHKRTRRRPRPRVERTSSFSSITDSTMSLNIITVTLNLDKINFLGISIVGQSNTGGDGGIYVGSIMKGGAVAADGRIEPGDMILQVDEVSFENMSNDDAVRVLREVVQKPGPIKLVVAKCWDPSPRGYFTIPKSEPIRPLDPAAWVAHTNAMKQGFQGGPLSPSMTSMTSATSSVTSSIPESDRYEEFGPLTIDTDMAIVVKAMAAPESGLEIRDRMWLKITISNAFIGSDLVDWLHTYVEGFQDRRDARKYSCNMLKAGYIKHTVNKITFSEQCYYIFGEADGLVQGMSKLSLATEEMSETDQDTLGPLPSPAPPYSAPVYMGNYQPPHGYQPMHMVPANYDASQTNTTTTNTGYTPLHQSFDSASSYTTTSFGNGSVGSGNSGSSGSSHSQDRDRKSGGGGGGGGGSRKGGGSAGSGGSDSDFPLSRNNWPGSREGLVEHQPHGAGPVMSLPGPADNPMSMPMSMPMPMPMPMPMHHHMPAGAIPVMPSMIHSGPIPVPVPTVPTTQGLPPVPPPRPLGSMPEDMGGSRQSFRMAMGNP